MAPKRPHARGYEELYEIMSRCARTTKECESTVEGEPNFTVESVLPSYFDYYPGVKRQVTSSSKAEAVKIMEDFLKFVRTGNKEFLRADPAELAKGEKVVVDLTSDEQGEAESEGLVRWQVSLGDQGWADLDDKANEACEKARREKRSTFSLVGYQGMPYTIDLDKSIQKNMVSGTVRPLRRTTDALFG